MEDTRERLLTSDIFVLEEFQRLQVFYKLKQEIRYGLSREENIASESVADHVYGMFILARYFAPLENPAADWEIKKIYDMILYHDIDEIETGDTIGYLKTDAQRSSGHAASERVIAQAPAILQADLLHLLQEYEQQSSTEARFVKALDKLEPVFHIYSEDGRKINKHHNTTFKQHMSIKRPALTHFPILERFNEVVSEDMRKRGFFTE